MIRENGSLRVDIGGGVTDIPEFSQEVGTSVTNFALDLFSDREYRQRRQLELEILRRGPRTRFIHNGSEQTLQLQGDDQLLLIKSTINKFATDHPLGRNYEIRINDNLPRSTGLGGSAGLSVCLNVGLNRVLAAEAGAVYVPNPNDVLGEAHHFEVEEMGIKGGFQDFIAAFFGNVNQIDFQFLHSVDLAKQPRLGVSMEPQMKEYMNNHMIVLLQKRGNISSSVIVQDEVDRYRQNFGEVNPMLFDIKEHNRAIYDILTLPRDLQPQLIELGLHMNGSWELQKKLSPLVGRGNLAALERLAAPHVYGLRCPGAGGNSLFLVMKPDNIDSLFAKLAPYSDDIEILFARVNEVGIRKGQEDQVLLI